MLHRINWHNYPIKTKVSFVLLDILLIS